MFQHRLRHPYLHNAFRPLAAAAVACCLFFSDAAAVSAAPSREESIAANQALPIQSNEVENWPSGPVVSAESAILMEAETGMILYAKNIHQHQYPASTTKILTSLIAYEESSLDEVVTFSHDAVFDTPRNSNHIAMNEGDTLTMEDCLYAILIRSANEVSFAVAEHVGGTREQFYQMMNDRAAQLGCVDSHFTNPNGLPDEDHYTSAYDLAMIGRAFFANELLCKITTTPMLVLQKKSGEYHDANQMDLIPGKKYAYEYLVGCKTGYTDSARNCLVSCAEKDGLRLICVILKDEAPYHYEDTIALFNYGFNNFEKINISQTETKYNIDTSGSFYSNNDILGSSKPILSLNKEDYIILPKTVSFEDVSSTISYDTENENQVALITYTYHDVFIGSASVDLAVDTEDSYSFNIPENASRKDAITPSFIFINVVKILLALAGAGALVILLLFLRVLLRKRRITHPHNRKTWRRERRKRSNHRPTVNSTLEARRREMIRQAKRRQRSKHRRG